MQDTHKALRLETVDGTSESKFHATGAAEEWRVVTPEELGEPSEDVLSKDEFEAALKKARGRGKRA